MVKSWSELETGGEEIPAWLNSAGFSALVLKYRTPNNCAGALQDAQRVLSLVRERAAEWNVDPQRLGIIGFSSGGHLAVRTNTSFGERSYPAIDAINAKSCRPDFAVVVYPAYLDNTQGQAVPELNLAAAIRPLSSSTTRTTRPTWSEVSSTTPRLPRRRCRMN